MTMKEIASIRLHCYSMRMQTTYEPVTIMKTFHTLHAYQQQRKNYQIVMVLDVNLYIARIEEVRCMEMMGQCMN